MASGARVMRILITARDTSRRRNFRSHANRNPRERRGRRAGPVTVIQTRKSTTLLKPERATSGCADVATRCVVFHQANFRARIKLPAGNFRCPFSRRDCRSLRYILPHQSQLESSRGSTVGSSNSWRNRERIPLQGEWVDSDGTLNPAA